MKVFKNKLDYKVVDRDGKAHNFSTYQNAAIFLYDQGVDMEEVEYGFTELINKDHDMAVYGIGLTGSPKFCYSEKFL